MARLRTRGQAVADRATYWVEDRRGEVMPVDLAVQFYERDRDSFASVLGAAIALRLFLFFVPVVLLVTAVDHARRRARRGEVLADNAGVTGSLATQIDQATTTRKTTTYGLLAGRDLAHDLGGTVAHQGAGGLLGRGVAAGRSARAGPPCGWRRR